MELQQLYDRFSLWESDFGLPEDTWSGGLLDVNQEDSGIGHTEEEDSIWKDTYNPLKEANNAVVSEHLNESLNFDVEKEFGQNDWLDERTDIGALLDNFIQSPEFDEVLSNFDDSGSYLKNMELADEPEEIVENTTEVNLEDVSIKEEATSDSNVEIEADEIYLQNTVVIYINQEDPCEVFSPSNDHIHNLTDANQPQNKAAISPSVSTTIKNEFIHIDDISGTEINELTSSQSPKEDAAFNELPSTSTLSIKSKRGRKKTRVEPYKNSWTKSNCSSSSSSICSSAPVSPSSEEYSDDSDVQMPTTTKRKERKKHQNRNAATKYRQKKRAETEAISSEEQALEIKNKELKEAVQALETEVGYLKGFMREIMIARGLIKN